MSNDAAGNAARFIDEAGWIMHRRREGRPLRKGEWALLRFLGDIAPKPATAKQFAAYYAVALRHARALAADIEIKGLVRRFSDPEVASSALIEITEKGREALARDPLRALAAALANEFEREELEDFCVVLTILLKAFVKEKLRPRAARRQDLADGCAAGKAYDASAAVALLASEATENVYQAGFTEDLKRNEWTALRYYHASAPSEPTAPTLTENVGIVPSLAHQATVSLSKKGLIERRRSKKHHNAFTILVTAKGRRKLQKDPLAHLEQILARTLSDEDNQRIVRLMEKVIASYDPAL